MLLVRGAHATTLGFMAAVGRLKFGKRITPQQHEWGLRLLAWFFFLGYPWLFTVWLNVLTVGSLRGRVAVGDGFLVMLSRRTTNPKPAGGDVLVGGLLGLTMAAIAVYLIIGGAAVNLYAHPTLVLSVLALTLLPTFGSALIRSRRDNLKGHKAVPADVLFVQGFIPTSNAFRHTARAVAPVWLARQAGPVAWVADEGLKAFYETILAQWQVKGIRVNPGRTGFRGLLWPPRYLFVKP